MFLSARAVLTGKEYKVKCANCDDRNISVLKACSGCKKAYYCCRKCQEDHWTNHKANCHA